MTSTARTSLAAIAAFLAGGLAVYGAVTLLPVSVTTTDVTLSEPAGHTALANAKAGIAEMDKASKAIDANNFDLTAISLAGAREKFAAVAKQAAGKDQPLLLAQEAVIVHQFKPDRDVDAVGVAAPDAATAANVTLTMGHKIKPLTLSNYAISFGDLSIDTTAVDDHLNKAIAAAEVHKKDDAARELGLARDAITVAYNGDDIQGAAL